MHHLQAALEHRWSPAIGLTVGLAAFVIGIAIGGEPGGDTRSTGLLVTLAALTMCQNRSAYAHGRRAGYRLGKRTRAQLAVLHIPRQDDRAAHR